MHTYLHLPMKTGMFLCAYIFVCFCMCTDYVMRKTVVKIVNFPAFLHWLFSTDLSFSIIYPLMFISRQTFSEHHVFSPYAESRSIMNVTRTA